MFEVIQIEVAGAFRKALRTIPPAYVSYENNVRRVFMGAPLVTPVVIPNDCQVVTLGWIRTVIHPAAMFSGAGKLALNPGQPYLITETVIHELVHYHQRARMGPAGYAATYTAQLPGAEIDAMQKGGTWHDWHEMEREARRIALEIIGAHFYDVDGNYRLPQETVPIDAVFEIQKRLSAKKAA